MHFTASKNQPCLRNFPRRATDLPRKAASAPAGYIQHDNPLNDWQLHRLIVELQLGENSKNAQTFQESKLNSKKPLTVTQKLELSRQGRGKLTSLLSRHSVKSKQPSKF